jgi:hypothetical protein
MPSRRALLSTTGLGLTAALGEARFVCTAHAVVEFVPGGAGGLATT